jgi:hypothetical protein
MTTIPFEREVLQAIVAEDDIAAVAHRRLRGRGALAPHEHHGLRTARQHHGLITDFARIAVRRHACDTGDAAAITTRYHPHAMPQRRELHRCPGHERRFAGATDGEIADDDDRHLDAYTVTQPQPVQDSAHGHGGAVEIRQRREPALGLSVPRRFERRGHLSCGIRRA